MVSVKGTVAYIAVFAVAASTAAQLHQSLNYERYLQESNSLDTEVDRWLKLYEKDAKLSGCYPKLHANESLHREDLRQRFFMAKEHAEKMAALNPQANFSTDSPFTMMTLEEFQVFLNYDKLKDLPPPKKKSREECTDVKKLLPARRNATISGDGTVYTDRHLQVRTSLDWSTETNCIGPVQYQGEVDECDTDYVFTALGALQARNCLQSSRSGFGSFLGPLLSAQHLLSCSTGKGCASRKVDEPIRWAANNGLCTDAQVPYTQTKDVDGPTCTQANAGCPSSGRAYFDVLETSGSLYDDRDLIPALNSQPVMSVVYFEPLKQYKSGIVTSCPRAPAGGFISTDLLIVGYDENMFKLRTSFGTSFGENGYIRLQRMSGNPGTCSMYWDNRFLIPCTVTYPSRTQGIWYYLSRTSDALQGGCTNPTYSAPKRWVMLRSYRSGGTEGVHWKYSNDPNDPECMNNWRYHRADGITLVTSVTGRLTNSGSTRTWCAMNTYRDGGVQGYQWEYCSCA